MIIKVTVFTIMGFPGGAFGKELAANSGDIRDGGVQSVSQEDQPTPVFRIPWTEEPDRLQSIALQSRTRLK